MAYVPEMVSFYIDKTKGEPCPDRQHKIVTAHGRAWCRHYAPETVCDAGCCVKMIDPDLADGGFRGDMEVRPMYQVLNDLDWDADDDPGVDESTDAWEWTAIDDDGELREDEEFLTAIEAAFFAVIRAENAQQYNEANRALYVAWYDAGGA